MKTNKFLAIVALVLPLVFVSCSSDDDDVIVPAPVEEPEPIVTSFTVDGVYYSVISQDYLTIEYLGSGSFLRTESVIIPQTVTYGDKEYTVTRIGDSAFYGCSLQEITIPNTILEIGNNAFFSCGSLKSINLPNSLESIGNYAFESSGLLDIDLPNSLLNIGDLAFAYTRGCVKTDAPSFYVL